MQSLAISLTIDRENGILKRGRGTPLPSWVFFAGRVGNAIVISVLMLVVVRRDRARCSTASRSPGSTCRRSWSRWRSAPRRFCCLGVALTAAIPTEDAAPPITNVAVLPLYFLSGVFIPETEIPDGVLQRRRRVPDPPLLRGVLRRLGPGHHRRRASSGATSPSSPPGGSPASLLAVRFFRWTPSA